MRSCKVYNIDFQKFDNTLIELYRSAIVLQSQGNFKEAANKFHELAVYGHAAAQFDLGWLYFNGRGVKKDKSQAYYWWNEAHKNGYKDAHLLMESIKSHQKDQVSDDSNVKTPIE